jgi:hypothetical protein
MSLVLDVENNADLRAFSLDRLRKEVGKFYRTTESAFEPASAISESKIKTVAYSNTSESTNSLLAKKRQTIFFTGKEEMFSNQIVWRDFVLNTINLNKNFSDHTFEPIEFNITSNLTKNYHHPEYEDSTKIYQTRQLFNYNLVSLDYKTDSQKRISFLETKFDISSYQINDAASLYRSMKQFPRRLVEYSGSVSEVSRKQGHIFKLNNSNSPSSPIWFPYFLEKEVDQAPHSFASLMMSTGISKKIFQSIKNNLSLEIKNFYVNGYETSINTYDLTNILLNVDLSVFNEGDDEMFLLNESEQLDIGSRGRFINNIRATLFLSEYSNLIKNNLHTIEQIFDCESKESILLGYKIEKYENRQSDQPIQVYYTTDKKFYDTQLKYGTEYIYKTKALIGVVGTSYTYSNVTVSDTNGNMVDSEGEVVSAPLFGLISDIYKASVDVEISPSVQIMEYIIETRSHAFIDAPTMPPQVNFYHDKKRPTVNMILTPNFHHLNSGGIIGGAGQELSYVVPNAVLESEETITRLLSLSDQEFDPRYFYGNYQIFRMMTPPSSEKDFASNLLTSVNTENRTLYHNSNQPGNSYYFTEKDYSSYFVDFLIPNQKYYYCFRTLTYHETPSKMTDPFEIELIKDSDEHKIVVKKYKYPENRKKNYKKRFKRFLKITPNLDRIEPLLNIDGNLDQFGIGENKLVTIGDGNNFKIRITSIHTGKTIDLDLHFKGEAP